MMAKVEHEYCMRCGRKLKNPIARNIGYGQVCLRKLSVETSSRLFDVADKKVTDKVE